MDDLVTWLRAQLDEDERVAKAAGGEDWSDEALAATPVPEVGTVGYERQNSMLYREYWEHIARHDPARVLREVEAKRRIVEQFTLRGDSNRATIQPSTGGVWDDLMRLLALPYADRPGYRDEWAPEG